MLRCACGEMIQVPTLSGMASLGRSESEQAVESVTAGWGWSQRLLFLGSVLVAVAIVAALVLLPQRPLVPTHSLTPEVIGNRVETLSPVKSFELFKMLRETGLEPGRLPMEREYDRRMGQYRIWIGALAAVAVIGVVLIVLGLAKRQARPRPARPS